MIPAFPIGKPKGSAAKQAAELHGAAVEAADNVQVVYAVNADADATVAELEQRYTALLAETRGHHSPEEEQLSHALASARVRASHDVKLRRIAAAEQAAAEALDAFATFCRDHGAELLSEVAPSADKAAADVAKAQEAAEELLSGPLAARNEAGQLMAQVLDLVGDGGWQHSRTLDWNVPTDPALSPVPEAARELIARHASPAAYDRQRENEIRSARASADEWAEKAIDLWKVRKDIPGHRGRSARQLLIDHGYGQYQHEAYLGQLDELERRIAPQLREAAERWRDALLTLRRLDALESVDDHRIGSGQHPAEQLAAGLIPTEIQVPANAWPI